jgi:hypothetical protein
MKSVVVAFMWNVNVSLIGGLSIDFRFNEDVSKKLRGTNGDG